MFKNGGYYCAIHKLLWFIGVTLLIVSKYNFQSILIIFYLNHTFVHFVAASQNT